MCDEIYCSDESGSLASAETSLLTQGNLLDTTNHRLDNTRTGDKAKSGYNLTGSSQDKPFHGEIFYSCF